MIPPFVVSLAPALALSARLIMALCLIHLCVPGSYSSAGHLGTV